jgi:hypothetical protein
MTPARVTLTHAKGIDAPMVRSFLGREQDHAQQFVNDFQGPCGGQ